MGLQSQAWHSDWMTTSNDHGGATTHHRGKAMPPLRAVWEACNNVGLYWICEEPKAQNVFPHHRTSPASQIPSPCLLLEQSFSSVAQSCQTLCDPMKRSTPGLPVYHQLLDSIQIHVHQVGDAIQPSHPLSSSSPPALNLPQHQGLFKWVSSCIRWPKYWSFSFNISPSNEHPGLISFRMDWLDLQGTLKSLLQHHSSKASILQLSAFFIVQLSHPYVTTGKTIALTRRTLVGKVMSLLLNMLSRLVITFLPKSKHLLIFYLEEYKLIFTLSQGQIYRVEENQLLKI